MAKLPPYIRLAALITALSGLLSTSSVAQDITAEEVKASYILKLTSYTETGNPPHPIRTLCYYEKPGVPFKESVGQILAKYVEKTPAPFGKPLSVKRFEAIRNLSGCDVFYIPGDEEANVDNILSALGTSSTLTISAAPRFIMRGGMIGFVLDDNDRVKMEGNLANIKKNNVTVDSAILEVMLQVMK